MKRISPRTYAVALVLFLLTVVSTHWVGAENAIGHPPTTLAEWLLGARFAMPLLAILVAHESGHFFTARRRGVRASPPMFIPVPIAVLGTMGAVIGLANVRRRAAMLEIGASGPIAGLVVALPVLAIGLTNSTIGPLPVTPYMLEGRSILYLVLVRIFAGPIGEGQDVLLAPEAFAGWAGLLVTMANLVPLGQLDGGHVARALFGAAHGRMERPIHRGLLLIGIGVCLTLGVSAYVAERHLGRALEAATGGLGWLVWAGMISLLGRLSGQPPEATAIKPRSRRDTKRLHRTRKLSRSGACYAARKVRLRARLTHEVVPRTHRVIGIATLLCFPLLFMPFWLRVIRP